MLPTVKLRNSDVTFTFFLYKSLDYNVVLFYTILGVKKLENAVLKLYLINAVTNNKPEKVIDFFLKLTPELQNQPEWKDWFGENQICINSKTIM